MKEKRGGEAPFAGKRPAGPGLGGETSKWGVGKKKQNIQLFGHTRGGGKRKVVADENAVKLEANFHKYPRGDTGMPKQRMLRRRETEEGGNGPDF